MKMMHVADVETGAFRTVLRITFDIEIHEEVLVLREVVGHTRSDGEGFLKQGQGLIDFAGSLWFPPGSLRGRAVFPWLKRIDDSAFLKWKQRLAPDSLSEKERRRLRKMSQLRGWWFFNRPGSHTP